MEGDADLIAQDGNLSVSGRPHPESYDPTQDRERIRGLAALLLIGLLIATMGGVLIGLARGWVVGDSVEKVSTALISPIVGLVGTVPGFYFGAQTRRDG